ncbi:MAG: tetratricopeptide repeat protein [Phycisphaeraceae bacterium]
MAGRVNTRFVVILAVAVVILVGGVVGVVSLTSRRDPARYMARASELLNSNEYEKAAEAMDRAYQYEKETPKRIGILMQRAEALLKVSAPTSAKARELLGQVEGCWRKIVELDPANVKASRNLLDLAYRRAEMFPQFIQMWDQLYKDSQDMLKYSPDNLPARRYRGLAQVMRISNLNLGEQAAKDAQDDLRAALQHDPNDVRAAVALAMLDMNAAEEAARINHPAKAKTLQKQAMAQIDQFVQTHPDDPQALMGRFQLLMRAGVRNKDQDTLDKAMTVLDRIEAVLLKSDHPEETRDLAGRLVMLDGKIIQLEDGREVRSGLHRAEQLLRHTATAHSDDVATLMALGAVLQQQQRWDDALAFFKLARKDRAMPVNIAAMTPNDYRQSAAKSIVDIHLVQYELAKDAAEKKTRMEQVAVEMKELETIAGDNSPILVMMQGKIALVKGDGRLAITKLEKVNAELESRNAEVLGLLASAYLADGQTGAAATTLEKLMAAPGGALQLKPYMDLARLRLRSGDVAGATDLLDRVLKFQPQNTDALLLKSQAMIQAAKTPAEQKTAVEAALASLKPLAQDDDRRVTQQIAALNERAGHTQAAIAVLDGYLKNHSDDMPVLQNLVRLQMQTGQKEQARQRVEQALAADPQNKVLGLLLASIKGDSNIGDMVQKIIEQQEDPLSRQVALWQYFSRSGKTKEAADALAEAKKIAPDNEQVLGILFDQAVGARDWTGAARIVDQVKKMNDGAGLDYAAGTFWQARLDLAQDKPRNAIATLERGLKLMPSDSQAWLMLGTAQLQTGDVAGAERSIRKSIDLKPENTVAWQQLFRLHDQQGDYTQAMDDLKKALGYSGGGDDLVMQYIAYLGQHGDPKQAVAMREQLAKARPDDADNQRALAELYQRTGEPAKGKTILDQLMAKAPDDLANISAVAVYLARNNQFDQGLELIRNHVHQRGDQATAGDWAVFARYLRGGNQAEPAIAAYKQAISRDTGDAQAVRREYADWMFSAQQYDQAAEQYEQVLSSAGTKDVPGGKLLVWRRYIETLMNAAKLDQGETELAKLIQAYPSDPQAQLLKGLMCERRLAEPNLSDARKQQLTEEADLAYDRAASLAPNQAMGYVQRARFRFNREDELAQTQVRDDLNKAVEIDPNNAPARQMLAAWHLKRNDSNSALAELNRLIQLSPNFMPARAQMAEIYLNDGGSMSDLARLLDDSIQRMPDVPAWYQYRARMYQMQQQFDPAEKDLAKAYELDKTVGRMAEYAGLLLRRHKDAQALNLLHDWPKELGGSPVLTAMRGQALYRLNRTDEAMASFNMALDLANRDARQYNMVLPQMLAVMGGQALLDLLAPRVREDDSGTVALAAARVRLEMGQSQQAMGELEALAGKFKPDDPQETDRQRMLARVYFESKQFDKSRAAYESVLQINRRDLMALNNLAFMLADDMNDPRAALPLAQRAVDAAGNNPEQRANVLDTQGWVQFRANDLLAAEETLRRSVNLSSMPANNLHLAKVYLATNRPTEARQVLMQAKALAETQKDTQMLQQVQDLLKSFAKPANPR